MDGHQLVDLLAEHAPAADVAGAAVAVVGGDETTVACWGSAGGDESSPVTPETRFAVISVTKPMVATAVARLVQEGALDLDVPLAGVVPELRDSEWGRRATGRHLLANLSGIALNVEREFLFGGGDDALAALTASAGKDPAGTDPGSAWSYCNQGWSVLGRVIEVATGEVWESAMRRLVFEPCSMTGAGFAHEDGPRAVNFSWQDGRHVPATPWDARGCGPAGSSVLSSVEDLAAFSRAHLADESLAFLREEHAAVAFPWFLDAWCLGFARFDWPGGPVWGWDGIGPGARAILRLVPGSDGAVVLLTNTDTGRALYRSLFPVLLDDAFGVEMAEPPREGEVADLARYEGTYAWSDRTLTVRAAGDVLAVTDSLGSEVIARPLDDRNFLGDPDHPDGDTWSFSCFDDDGRPAMAHRLVWGFPRVS